MPRPPMQQNRQRSQGQGQGQGTGGGAGRGSRRGNTGEVWVLRDGVPSAVKVKIGLSDSKLTEVISDELADGSVVITGAGTGNKP